MLDDKDKLINFRKDSLHITQQNLADKLKVSLGTISMIECGQRKIKQDLKELIKQTFNYDIDKQCYITEKEYTTVTSNIIPIPFYHVKAAANPKGEMLPDYTEEEALYFDKRWLKNVLSVNPYNCSIIEAKGDSMDSGLSKSDDIKDGDLLLIDNSRVDIINNKTFIIEIINMNEIMVKKVVQSITGKVTLLSNNSKYPPRELTETDNALIIGQVMWNGSKELF